MGTTPIALQLYSVRGEIAKSLPATLKTVAELGFAGAEPWGYDGSTLSWQGHGVKEIRRMYDEVGLACCGIHLATDALRGDRIERTIEFNRELGNHFLIIAADRGRMATREGISELAGILNAAAERLQREKMFAGYHAHNFDFAKIDGEIAWDILFGSTRSDVVMQMDIGNCASGGGDPIAHLRKFPGRAKSVHLKDFGGREGSVLGEGKMDWPTIFDVCRTLHKPEWYVIEEGGADGTGFDISGRSLQAVRKFGL